MLTPPTVTAGWSASGGLRGSRAFHPVITLVSPLSSLGICFAEAALQIVDDASNSVLYARARSVSRSSQLFAAGTVQSACTPSGGMSLILVSSVKPYFLARPCSTSRSQNRPHNTSACLDRASRWKGAVRNNERRVHLHKVPSPCMSRRPKGLLNENMRGASSSMEMPCSGQA
jgi:hypothetical protein